MVALGLQLTFAAIASFRGWGLVPWGLLIVGFSFAYVLGGILTNLLGAGFYMSLLVTIDWVIVALLAFAAFVPKEK